MPTPQTIRAMREAVGHHQAGRVAEAERIYRAVLQQDSRDADALQLLGLLHHQCGKHAEAVDLIKRAIQIRPDGVFYVNLSQAQRSMGLVRDALDSCRRAVQLSPKQAEAWNNLGSLLQQLGQVAEAIPALQRAVQLNPRYGVAYSNLGNALSRAGKSEDAITAFKRAIEIDPKHAAAYINLANLLSRGGRLDESIDLCRRAIAIGMHAAPAYVNMGVALHIQGRMDEGNAAFEQGIALDPTQAKSAENLLAGMCYTTRKSPQAILDAHVSWARRFADPFTPASPTFANDRNPNRKLRIAYISPDLKRHSVAYFLEPILESHDRANFEITAYSNTDGPDDVSLRLQNLCDHWRDVVPMTDEELAAQIRADGIDVLIDLAGHTVGNRLLALARKPAPVQMTYLGYPGTTGMRAIDYRITDALADPEGESDRQHSEKLLRVSPPFVRYRPPAEAPDVVDPPMLSNGYVTFGSFNKLAKAGPETIALWSKVLNAIPTARLIMKSVGIQSDGAKRRILDTFRSHGIEPARLELIEATQPLAQHLGLYGRIDIALDTYPYHGTTTTCEALWMGVPVVSLLGETHVARVGLSLLSAVGKAEWATSAEADFVELARKLSGDGAGLTESRRGLRNAVKSTKLCDYGNLARQIEGTCRQSFLAWANDQRHV